MNTIAGTKAMTAAANGSTFVRAGRLMPMTRCAVDRTRLRMAPGAAEARAVVGAVAPVEDAGLAHRTRLVAVPVTSP